MSQSAKIIGVICLILGLLFFLPKTRSIFFLEKPVNNSENRPIEKSIDSAQANTNFAKQLPKSSDVTSQPEQITNSTVPPSTPQDNLSISKEHSEKEKKKFENTALIKLNLPDDFVFMQQESDDGMVAIVGRKQKSGQIYGIFARQGLSSNEEVEKFLPELPDQIPGFSSNLANAKVKAETFELSADSPFKNAYTWQVQKKNEVLYLIKADRKDNLGSYMIFKTGPISETAGNEKDFEKILDNVQLTQPEQ